MPRAPGPIVTRFAPSPTGYLHIGGARTALFNWAFARRHGGTFILRIEDTDKARSTPEATRRILSDLQWLGIDWDEGPNADAPGGDVYNIPAQKGSHGPYFQSQREHLYREYLQKLIAIGRAYEDKGAYRFKMDGKPITVHDLVLGDVTIQPDQLEDFVIMKGEAAGGGPTFHFANVVDDATMEVTHVLRAQEHLMNTPKHVAMFDALGIPRPKYAHMPLIFNPDGSKMSKRDKAKAARLAVEKWMRVNKKTRDEFIGDLLQSIEPLPGDRPFTDAHFDRRQVEDFLDKRNDDLSVAQEIARLLIGEVTLPEIDVHDFRKSGYLQPVILNYIALLGWSPGSNVERFDLDYLVKNFDLERIGKSNAKFDRTKLLAFNAEALAKLPADEFRRRLEQHCREFHPEYLKRLNPPAFARFAAAYGPRSRTLEDPIVNGRFFIVPDDELEFDAKSKNEVLLKNDGEGLVVLRHLRTILAALAVWDPVTIDAAIKQFADARALGMGKVAQPLRVAASGSTVSPPIGETLVILGKESTLRRIDRCLDVAAHP